MLAQSKTQCISHICYHQLASHKNLPFVANDYKNGTTYNSVRWTHICHIHRLVQHEGQDYGAASQPLEPTLPYNNASLSKRGNPVLCRLVDNQQTDDMPLILAGQAHPGAETNSVKVSTFVPHFQTSHFLAERRSPKPLVFKSSSYLRFFSSYLRFFCPQYNGSF